MDYTNQKCPVCNKSFTADSDVVVCPDCGTPHHRECYAETGFCANSARHKDGYNYYQAEMPQREKEEAPRGEIPAGEDKPAAIPGPFGAYDPSAAYGFYRGEAVREDRDIGGVTAGKYGKFLGARSRAYIPRFIYLEETGKRIVWNVFAFFFPFTFAAVKKMYKAALLLLAVDLLFFGFSVYSSLRKEPVRALAELTIQAESDGKLTEDETELLNKAMQKINETESKADWTDAVLELRYLDNIFMGLLATYFYKKDCTRKIRVITDAPVPPEVAETMLRRMGKNSVLLPVLGYIAIAITIYSVFGYLMLYK